MEFIFTKNKILIFSFILSACLHLLIISPWFSFRTSNEPESVVISVLSNETRVKSKNQNDIKNLHEIGNPSDNQQSVKSNETRDRSTIMSTDIGIEVIYPRLSRELGEVGQVLIELSKDSDQKLGEPKLLASSGYFRLDDAAIHATRLALTSGILYRFFQARPDLNHDNLKVTFIFKLSDPQGF